MTRHLVITSGPIDGAALMSRHAVSEGTGAVVYFAGIVRRDEGQVRIAALDYECFRQMAEHQFQLIFDAVEKRWPVQSVQVIHRIGVVQANEPSLWVEVSAPHRQEAFAACQWLIDEMKRVAPIWKRPVPREVPPERKRVRSGGR